MKTEQRCIRVIVILFGIIFSGWGLGLAHADNTVEMFTGTWGMFCVECGALKDSQSVANLSVNIPNLTAGFSFNGSISGYSNDQGCTPVTLPCMENWSGEFSGGSVSFFAYDSSLLNVFSFTGVIIGGTFSGSETCDSQECGHDNLANFAFASTWPNGWRSVGTVSAESGGFYSLATFGTLTMTTVVPEPTSMALLGSGILAVASFFRRRLSIGKI